MRNSTKIGLGIAAGFVIIWLASQDGGNKREGKSEEVAYQIEEAISAHQVIIGMTDEQAHAAWGRPKDINRTVLRNNSVHEQWCYGSVEYGMRYLYFEDGVLVTVQGGKSWDVTTLRTPDATPKLSLDQAREQELVRREEVLRKAGIKP